MLHSLYSDINRSPSRDACRPTSAGLSASSDSESLLWWTPSTRVSTARCRSWWVLRLLASTRHAAADDISRLSPAHTSPSDCPSCTSCVQHDDNGQLQAAVRDVCWYHFTCLRWQQCDYTCANLSLALEDVVQLKAGVLRLGPAGIWLSSRGSVIATSVQLQSHCKGQLICNRLQQRHHDPANPQVVHWAVCQRATHRQQALRWPATCTKVCYTALPRAEAVGALTVVMQHSLT